MRMVVTVVGASGQAFDLLLVLEEGATLADATTAIEQHVTARSGAGLHEAAALSQPGGPGGPQPSVGPGLWVDGVLGEPTAPAAAVLREGSRVALDAHVGAGLRQGEPAGFHELRVSGGPGSGRVARLALGQATVGSAGSCTVVIDDPTLPAVAGSVIVALDGKVSFRTVPGVEIIVEGAREQGDVEIPLGVVVQLGDSVLVIDRVQPPDAHLAPTGEGGSAYNRPPRLRSPRHRPRLLLPSPPSRWESSRLNILSAVVPLVFGVMMYLITDYIYMLLFCLMSPVLVVGQWITERRHGKKKARKSLRRYREELREHDEKLADAVREDRERRRSDAPDPAEILLVAAGPRRRLWERRLVDEDVLRLRVGTAAQPAAVDIVPPPGADPRAPAAHSAPPSVDHLPALVPLAEVGVLGVSGDRGRALRTARWLTLQASVLHSPRDLSVVLLCATADRAEGWEWFHWLPHARPRQDQRCHALVGCDPESVGRRVAELVQELERRKVQAGSHGWGASATLAPEPRILVVLDGARLLRRVPGVPQLLSEGPGHGIVAICLDDEERLLPEEVRVAIGWTNASAHHVGLRGLGAEDLGQVLADQVSGEWCGLVARSLAPVRDVSRDAAGSTIPDSARLLGLLSMSDPTPSHITRIWRTAAATTSVPVGISSEGPFYLDIRHDGPHALVAGTTGAGKSELLQTIIASLAVHNTPEELNFVLIDYKGGSAFLDCADLPHTVGMVSDLDAHLVERALASLRAELHRRERLFFESRNANLESYAAARRSGAELPALPRLMIVIDEFAALVSELPEFIDGLIDVARRGRSLGVHLVLATQRPAGVVSADMRANTNLRIALRVTSAAESADVIDSPDAGLIGKGTPGRMYVRSGAQSLVAVQTARVGGSRPDRRRHRPGVHAQVFDWRAAGRPPLTSPGSPKSTHGSATDLSVLVAAVRGAANELKVPPPRRPWLEPLPSVMAVGEVPPVVHRDQARAQYSIGIGVTDRPDQQARTALTIDLAAGGHLMFVGGPRSGKSTALRTVAGVLARSYAARDVHVYAIDCGSNALAPLVALPHTGAVVTREQPDRIRRLLERLQGEVRRRQQLLAERGESSVAEQRQRAADAAEQLPFMVLLLDGWEGFVAAFEKYNYGVLLESMHALLRDGPSVGLTAVVAADRGGLLGQIGAAVSDKHLLRLTDPADYSVAGLRAKDVPANMPPGRTVQLTDGGPRTSQLALLTDDESGPAQVKEVQRIARAAEPAQTFPAQLRPIRVDALPSRISYAAARALDTRDEERGALWAMLGVGGDTLRPLGVDLAFSGPGFVVAGPPRSGRSNVLLCAAESLLEIGTPLVVITPRRSPLRELHGRAGVAAHIEGEATAGQLAEALATVAGGPFVVVVDDAELVYDTGIDKPLESLIRSGMDGGHGLLIAGTTDSLSSQYRGFVATARKSRNGLVLRPSAPADGEMFGVRMPSNAGAGPVGSGIMVLDGSLTPVQSAAVGE